MRLLRLRSARRPSRREFDVVFFAPAAAPLVAQLAQPDGRDVVTGGAETQVVFVALALASRGLQVGLVVHCHPRVPDELRGVAVATIPDVNSRWRPIRGLAYVAAVTRTIMFLDATTFVQRTASSDTAWVALPTKLRRRRFVFSSSSTISFDFSRRERRPRDCLLYRLGILLADTIVVQTEDQAMLCAERLGRSSVLIKSLAQPAERRRSEAEAFLWAGRFEPTKDPGAFVELARSLPYARFRMVGRAGGPEGLNLQRQIERASTELHNLQVSPPLPRTELLSLMDRAVAVVSTSLFEGMPNVFLEAWARGVPVLSLRYDPDGVIERERLGGFANGSQLRLVELAADLWQRSGEEDELAVRCQGYVRREHGVDATVEGWSNVLTP